MRFENLEEKLPRGLAAPQTSLRCLLLLNPSQVLLRVTVMGMRTLQWPGGLKWPLAEEVANPPWSTAMAAGWTVTAAVPSPSQRLRHFSPSPAVGTQEALVGGRRAESSAAAEQYADTWRAFVCLGEQPSCSPSPASYQLQI